MGLLLHSCSNDKYRSNRFAGVYTITKYTTELWDSSGMVSSSSSKCNYVFYLTANENEFGNADGKMDTSGAQPSFLEPLRFDLFSGIEKFTFNWNLGTSDNYRLSLLKTNGLITNSVIVNVKRNAAGQVNAFTYFRLNGDGTYYFDKFDVKFHR